MVTASISGYGLEGPMADRPVYDPVIQALTGYVATQVNPEMNRALAEITQPVEVAA